MRSVAPILAPLLANESSYCLLTAPMILHFWWRITNAFAVIISIVRSVLGIIASLDNDLREAPCVCWAPVQAVVAMRCSRADKRCGHCARYRKPIRCGCWHDAR